MKKMLQGLIYRLAYIAVGIYSFEKRKASTDAKEWMKGYLMKSIGRKWKDWKCEIKKQAYYPYRTNVEILVHKLDRVEESHWRALENKKNNGKKMSRIKFFKVAYSKKDGRPVNDVVAQALSDMDELPSQMSDEVFTQVMGPERPGCVRTYGFGPSPRYVFGRKKSEEMQAMQSQLDEQLSRHKAER
ncbi:unnamed protein product [Ilex paraguariensis]|uniref:Uncharacterized protein n=1 Tax=Ilex paraguariensis TaxID=185542 RepID=A0ABC8UKA4_9AQUA